jgi:hypothetical protein
MPATLYLSLLLEFLGNNLLFGGGFNRQLALLGLLRGTHRVSDNIERRVQQRHNASSLTREVTYFLALLGVERLDLFGGFLLGNAFAAR